jgi:hypothetical protein
MYAYEIADPVRSRADRQAPVRPRPALVQHAVRPGAAHDISRIDTSARSPVQGKFQFDNFDGAIKKSESKEKFDHLRGALQNAKNQYINFLQNDPQGALIVNLDEKNDKNPGDASIIVREGASSAWSYTSPGTWRKQGQIFGVGAVVNIRKWFFDEYPAGKILAMAAHEVGVHVVPYMNELIEKLGSKSSTTTHTKTHGEVGKDDHLRVADVQHEDFQLYRGVVISMMDALTTSKTGKTSAADLADAYLMDLATFTSSGGRIPFPYDPFSIAERYNQFATTKPKIDVVPKKTWKSVFSDYVTLYTRVIPVVEKQHPNYTMTAKAVAGVLVACLLYYLWKLIFGR